jgi:hypothetical protein
MNDMGCDNIDYQNFKGIYYNSQRYIDKSTGAHFDFNEVCKKLNSFLHQTPYSNNQRTQHRLTILATQAFEKISPLQLIKIKQMQIHKPEFNNILCSPKSHSKIEKLNTQPKLHFAHSSMDSQFKGIKIEKPNALKNTLPVSTQNLRFNFKSMDMRKSEDPLSKNGMKMSIFSSRKISMDYRYTGMSRNRNEVGHLLEYLSNPHGLHKRDFLDKRHSIFHK